MNLVRSILIAGILVVVGTWSADPGRAQTPHQPTGTPTRLATQQPSVGQLIRSRFTTIQLVSNELIGDEDESEQSDANASLELQEDLDPTDKDDTNDQSDNDWDDEDEMTDEDSVDEDQKRQSSMATRIAALNKRANEITIRTLADGATPQNRAQQLSLAEPVIAITALGVGPTGPMRYTTCFMHQPLYFEQSNLERCGNGHGCWQNSVSGIQFLGNTILLPYHLGRQRCDCTVHSGGDCQCCESLPRECKSPLIRCRGLTAQAAAVAGFTLLVL